MTAILYTGFSRVNDGACRGVRDDGHRSASPSGTGRAAAETHGFDDDTADTLGGLDEVIVSQMRIAGGRGVAAVPEHLADQGAGEEPNCGARRVQYQAAVVRKSVRSVVGRMGARRRLFEGSRRPDGPKNGKKSGGEPLEIYRRGREVGLGLYVVEAASDRAPEPVPSLRLAVVALGAPEVTSI